MSDDPLQVPPDIDPDRIALALTNQYPQIINGIPKGFVSFRGYLAPEHNGLRRMFCDNSFRKYIEVKGFDIKARIDVPTNAADSRSEIFIDRDVDVIMCQVHKAHELDMADLDPGGNESGGRRDHPPWP